MKRFIHSIVVLSGSVTILMLGLSFLLFKPLDRHAWRIEFHVPILGEVSVNAYPLLQIAVSLPGRKLLNGTRWQSSHGVLWLQNESGVLWVNCEPCTFLIPELSKYPVRIDRLSLSVRLINRQLSGLLSLQSGAYAS